MKTNDLRSFADDLDVAAFKALSAGIGFGAVKKSSAAAQPIKTPPEDRSPAVDPPVFRQPEPRPSTPSTAKPRNAPAAPQSRTRQRLSIEKKLIAWSLDFFFVALTLGVLLSLVTVITAARTGNTEDIFALAPIQWLMGIRPLELVAGVYGLFFAYVLLFKTVAGVTLGESLLRARLARAP